MGGVPVIVATGPVVSTVNVPFGKIYAPVVRGFHGYLRYADPRDELSLSKLFLAASDVRLSIEPPVTLISADRQCNCLC